MPHRSAPALGEIYDALDSGIVVLDRDRRILAWNAWLAIASGVSAEAALGRTLADTFHSGVNPRLLAAIGQVFDFGASSLLTHSLHPDLFSLRTRAGRVLVHDVSLKPIGAGSQTLCLIQVVDVTVAVERERVLRERYNARYAAVVDHAPDAILTLDSDGIIQFANAAAQREFGYAPQDIIGQSVAMLFKSEAEWVRVWAALSGGGQRTVEGLGRQRDGALTHVEISAARWTDYSRAFVSVILRDVDERVAAREALKRWGETLEERVASTLAERKVLADIVERSPAAVTALDLDGRILAINEANVAAFERAFGRRPAVGEVFFSLFSEVSELLSQQRKIWDRALAGETFEVIEEFGDERLEKRCYEVRFSPLLSAEGQRIGATSTSYDVTDRVRDQERLRQTEDALRQAQKMEAVGQLTGGLAHDFNNLLTIIRSSTDFLRRQNLSEERRARYVNAISDTADRAAKLTSQLLAFARRQPLLPTVFDVSAQVDTISVLIRQLLGSRIVIDVTPCDGPCFTNADVGQFETALINLAVNARDAMDGEGRLLFRTEILGGLPAIRSSAPRVERVVAVTVTDNGTGIELDKLEAIFEPFYTTKEVGKGTGLGLSQVFGFSQQSGGDIAVRSQLGKGSTFTLYLPLVEPPADNDSAHSVTAVDDACAGSAHCILVVEDNQNVGGFSTELLNDLGYNTRWVATGKEALAALAEDELAYDLVFTDVIMPGMNGVDLARAVRSRYPGLPVVLTSGYSNVLTDGDHGFQLVHKPYSVESLARVLRQAISARRG